MQTFYLRYQTYIILYINTTNARYQILQVCNQFNGFEPHNWLMCKWHQKILGCIQTTSVRTCQVLVVDALFWGMGKLINGLGPIRVRFKLWNSMKYQGSFLTLYLRYLFINYDYYDDKWHFYGIYIFYRHDLIRLINANFLRPFFWLDFIENS